LGEVFHHDATYLDTGFWRFWHELSKSEIRLAHPYYLQEIWEKFLTQQRKINCAETLIVDAKVEYIPIIRTPLAGHYWPIFPVVNLEYETKIIRLYRKNVLAQIVSFHLARRSNTWTIPNLTAPAELLEKYKWIRSAQVYRCSENSLLRFDPEQLVSDIENTISQDRDVDSEIGSSIAYRAYYEDLFDNEGTISASLIEEVAKAVDIDPGTICRIPISRKQNTIPIADVIDNVDAVYDALSRRSLQWMLST
jgi:hypothetical protein